MKRQIKKTKTTATLATATFVNDRKTRTNNKYSKERKANQTKREIQQNGGKKIQFAFCARDRLTNTRS